MHIKQLLFQLLLIFCATSVLAEPSDTKELPKCETPTYTLGTKWIIVIISCSVATCAMISTFMYFCVGRHGQKVHIVQQDLSDGSHPEE
ncbi:E3 CR1-alpha [Caenorhabditis elegans]|uniref:E3 CR1-alpha n=1 Tax=Caenorhabditis elegans TaxID=6239 RepID=U4PMZ6_CAEEL|nr:E3 CR1-alpha [Caenorhabditis elegans]CDH93464.1 E3 CR1-alpha [Caenorhabditis elegans]|eukprot:NP_001294637.1 Uncharacterized protein CELE_F56D6.18 [Caenorhabditis elegans]